jgi:alpha-L-rhamnosidase
MLETLLIFCAAAFAAPDAMDTAQPVWAEGRESEMNLNLGFRAVFEAPAGEEARVTLKLTASTLYRAFVNGEFVGYGPARAGKDYHRVDAWDITPHLRPGRNVVAVEVAGYCVNSYYTFDSPAFLQAAVITDAGDVLASTAGDGVAFEGAVITERVQKVPRYSFQRPFCEVYDLKPNWADWRTDPGADFSALTLAVQPAHPLLARRVPYPEFEVLPAITHVAKGTVIPVEGRIALWKDRALTDIGPKLGGYPMDDLVIIPQHEVQRLESQIVDNNTSPVAGDAKYALQEGEFVIFDLGRNISGFPRFSVTCEEPVRLFATFDEILTEGDVDFKRLGCVNVLTYDLAPGEYDLEAFEPYTLRCLKIIAAEGACTVRNVGIRTYENPDTQAAVFTCSDSRLEEIFEAARHTFAQNAVDVFMDCPHRERAGWLCDSYFTARSALHFSGNTAVEHNFLENYALPETFEHLPEGMLPMCYPSDHNDGVFIPNWALWLVVQLGSYAGRGGEPALIEQLKPKVLALFDYFAPFENSDGLLEKLESWVFVEWSKANSFVQDVNYPSSMLYAGALSTAATLYGLPELEEKAEAIRETIREQSFDGEFFIDNALRKEDDTLEITQNHTEVCQYFAFFFDVATPETHGELQRRLIHEFGPGRVEAGGYPEVHPANMFIGHMARLELLSRWNEQEKVMESLLGYFHHMAEKTGTLWENDGAYASLNHGFASHAAVSLYRDVLGLREVDVVNKKIRAYIPEVPLDWCSGEMPVPGGVVKLRWEKVDGEVRVTLEAPDGYETEVTSERE